MLIGDQFLEVVSPTREGTTAGRLLDRRARDDGNGDGGYMAIYEVDDLDAPRRAACRPPACASSGRSTSRRSGRRHLHPRDVGGALVSIDQPARRGEWPWGGPTWRAHDGNGVVTAIAGVTVGATDPPAMRRRWAELGLDHAVRFVAGQRSGRGDRRARPRRDRPRPRRRDDGALRRRRSASCDEERTGQPPATGSGTSTPIGSWMRTRAFFSSGGCGSASSSNARDLLLGGERPGRVAELDHVVGGVADVDADAELVVDLEHRVAVALPALAVARRATPGSVRRTRCG